MTKSIITSIRVIFLIAALFFINGTLSAQTFERSASKAKRGFDITTAQSTGKTMTILGVDYEVGKSKNGSLFISLPKKDNSGNYPFWIGTETDHNFDGQTVRQTKSGKYFIFKKSSRGLPYYDYLTTNKESK